MTSPNPWLQLGARPGAPTWTPRAEELEDGPAPTSKTARMRAYLATHGPASSHDLAIEADVASSGLVAALLKHDVKMGRVELRGSLWHLVEGAEPPTIQKAIALLRRHGYTVSKP